jgi:hypothetical protein
MQEMLDLYSDYLLASFGATTATGLSKLLDGHGSHDQVTRYWSGRKQPSADLWRRVKPLVRRIQSSTGVLIIDDSIAEKPYTDQNAIGCWHYDQSNDQQVKGINFMTALYHSQEVSLPVGFHLIAKTECYLDKKTQQHKRRSPTTKNEYCRALVQQAVDNQLPFHLVLFDAWFACAETMMFLKHEVNKEFIGPLKTNRKVALRAEDKRQGCFVRVDTLALAEQAVRESYLAGVAFPLLLGKQLVTNEDGSTSLLDLVCSDTTVRFDEITTSYQKRWRVEEYHTSLKQNVSLAKSPTPTETTQTNHFVAALCGFIKLEMLKMETRQNHFALKSKLYLKALHSAFTTLRELKPVQFAA